jgi:hypothetical protein
VADFALSRRFSLDFAQWEASASERDRQAIERAMAEIVANARLRDRFPSFYDPANPSYLYRCANALIHYREASDGTVEFLNLYPR